eukprot:TRINITY_DN3131_c0_g1_i1.p1 TRINITY_DN3131_c0_g1~~TRINITY_DN3131_c0_g1_i1.p1  ORF type:complete len:496 (+),score=107.83 TRINITY_DN3131_c0_g1_i1:1079-2566(+)
MGTHLVIFCDMSDCFFSLNGTSGVLFVKNWERIQSNKLSNKLIFISVGYEEYSKSFIYDYEKRKMVFVDLDRERVFEMYNWNSSLNEWIGHSHNGEELWKYECEFDDNCFIFSVQNYFDCSCSYCINGYESSELNNTCVDIDECKTGRDNCPFNTDCVNEYPGYSCLCNSETVDIDDSCPASGKVNSNRTIPLGEWNGRITKIGELSDKKIIIITDVPSVFVFEIEEGTFQTNVYFNRTFPGSSLVVGYIEHPHTIHLVRNSGIILEYDKKTWIFSQRGSINICSNCLSVQEIDLNKDEYLDLIVSFPGIRENMINIQRMIWDNNTGEFIIFGDPIKRTGYTATTSKDKETFFLTNENLVEVRDTNVNTSSTVLTYEGGSNIYSMTEVTKDVLAIGTNRYKFSLWNWKESIYYNFEHGASGSCTYSRATVVSHTNQFGEYGALLINTCRSSHNLEMIILDSQFEPCKLECGDDGRCVSTLTHGYCECDCHNEREY